MAKNKKNTATYDKWTEVKGLKLVSIIGSPDRFSIHCLIGDDYQVQINGCRIVEGKKGSFISFPAWRDKDDNWHDYAFFNFGDDQDMIIDMFD